jgi:16S rRNA (guanine527-N7)-methyltransferase
MAEHDASLVEVLTEHQHLGLLGPGPVTTAIDHAAGFARVLRPAGTVLDLGSGGGLPGLVLARCLPATRFVLLDARSSRTDLLVRALGRLGLGDRVEVVTGPAEEIVRRPGWRERIDAVVARGFGPPAEVAECAAPFLRIGGQLVVSEPPASSPDRWPVAGLARVGLVPDPSIDPTYASCTKVEPCPDRYPRRRRTPPLY